MFILECQYLQVQITGTYTDVLITCPQTADETKKKIQICLKEKFWKH